MSNKEVVPIEIKAVIPTANGCAVFLGNDSKVFVIYVDPLVGNAISMMIRREKHERPLTHDLMGMMLAGFGARVERVIINDLKGATYYGRMILSAENELQQRKVLELDARPSDCMAMAVQQKAPIYATSEVWNETEDMSEVFRKMVEEAPEVKGNEGEDEEKSEG